MRGNGNTKAMEYWLRRTRRELMISGRLTELALRMDQLDPMPTLSWRARLQSLLSGEWIPSADEIIFLDRVISSGEKKEITQKDASAEDHLLF